MRACVLSLLILLFPGSLFAFWPVYWELGGQKNLLGPLITFERKDDATHVTVRPLLSSYDSPRTYSILFPLGKSTEEKAYFFPVYTRHSSGEDFDVALFPFFYGRAGHRPYGGMFPLGGKLYHRFRRDEIDFVLWPAYSRSTWNGTTRTNVLWPFFSFFHGTQEGFKLGPFYGRRQWGDERRSSFVMWPFFIRDEKDLGTDNPKSSYWAVPFYMQTTSPRSSFYAVMWPFFTYMRTPQKTEVKALWPVFSHTTGKEESAVGAWPIYSRTRSGADEVTYVLWPVYKGTERHPGDRTWVQKRILIIDKYEKDDRGTFLNVCPFFEYRASGEARTFFFPSIIPWRNEGFDRIMRPLLTLYEYRKTQKGTTTTNFLYGFYTKEQEGESWKRRLAFLLEVKREPAGMGFEVLSGLFAVDAKRVKVLYVPIPRSGAGPAVSGGAGEAADAAAETGAAPRAPGPAGAGALAAPDREVQPWPALP